MSAGRGSVNDSVMEGMSAGATTNLNDSIPKISQSQLTFVTAKAKPRDFKVRPFTMRTINADNYDKIDDMSQIAINVEEAMSKLKFQWKTLDEERLIYLIRK
jgi:hypothetical protein